MSFRRVSSRRVTVIVQVGTTDLLKIFGASISLIPYPCSLSPQRSLRFHSGHRRKRTRKQTTTTTTTPCRPTGAAGTTHLRKLRSSRWWPARLGRYVVEGLWPSTLTRRVLDPLMMDAATCITLRANMKIWDLLYYLEMSLNESRVLENEIQFLCVLTKLVIQYKQR